MCVCVCVRACVHPCVRVCVCVCVYACMHVCGARGQNLGHFKFFFVTESLVFEQQILFRVDSLSATCDPRV